MKKLLFFIAFISFHFTLSAQDQVIEEKPFHFHMEKSHTFSLGIGFPNLANTAFNIGNLIGVENEGYASPNFTLKYEYGLTRQIGVGVHLGYYTAKTPSIVSSVLTGDILDIVGDVGCELGINIPGIHCDTVFATENGGTSYDRIHATTLGARLAYHKENLLGLEKLDLYGTALFGYSFFKTKRIGSTSADTGRDALPKFIYNTSAGLRYYLNTNWALYGELGYGALTIINLGATYRIIPKGK